MTISDCQICAPGTRGIRFTQSDDQAGKLEADNVTPCTCLDGRGFDGNSLLAAEALAQTLAASLDSCALSDAEAYIAVTRDLASGQLMPGAALLRESYPEACIDGSDLWAGDPSLDETTIAVSHVTIEAPEPTRDPFTKVRDALQRASLALQPGTSHDERQHAKRDIGRACLAFDSLPDPRTMVTREQQAEAETSMRAAGLFQSLVATAELYCEAIGGPKADALSSMLQGLAENLEETQGTI